MKIGILTYHRAVNEGSVLQAYSVLQLIRRLVPDADVEFVDYRPREWERRERRKVFGLRPPFIYPESWAKLKAVRKFVVNQLPMSESHCDSVDLAAVQRFVAFQMYDAIVVGSDTVWEVRSGGVAPVPPNIYFLPGLAGVTRVGFAVSCDKTEAGSWREPGRLAWIRERVERFDLVTVRDEQTRYLLSLTGTSIEGVEILPDPTLLWDLTTIVRTPSNPFPRGPRGLVGVGVAQTPLRVRLTKHLRGLGYEVVNLLGRRVRGQHRLPSHWSLQERVGFFSAVDLLITDRFHGSIFALRSGRVPVILVEPDAIYPPGVLSKGRDLFRKLEIEPFVWQPSSGDVPRTLLDEVRSGWPGDSVRERLELIREGADSTLAMVQKALQG